MSPHPLGSRRKRRGGRLKVDQCWAARVLASGVKFSTRFFHDAVVPSFLFLSPSAVVAGWLLSIPLFQKSARGFDDPVGFGTFLRSLRFDPLTHKTAPSYNRRRTHPHPKCNGSSLDNAQVIRLFKL
jgi:hypothetical protein